MSVEVERMEGKREGGKGDGCKRMEGGKDEGRERGMRGGRGSYKGYTIFQCL